MNTEGKPEKEFIDVQLKQAGVGDIPTLIALETEVAGSKLYSPMITEQEWREALPKNRTYLIEVDNAIAGEVSYEMKDESHAYIDGLVVKPEFQGRGIARKAMEKTLEELKNVQEIDLVTHPENIKAISLYESLGFEIVGEMENYFGDGQPRVKMTLRKSAEH